MPEFPKYDQYSGPNKSDNCRIKSNGLSMAQFKKSVRKSYTNLYISLEKKLYARTSKSKMFT